MKIIEFQSLSDSDRNAVLAALPLILKSGFETNDSQNELNLSCAESLGKKLLIKESSITANELRILCLSVIFAQQHLSGKRRLSLDAATQAEISKYFFSYNKLAPSCLQALDILEKHFGLGPDS